MTYRPEFTIGPESPGVWKELRRLEERWGRLQDTGTGRMLNDLRRQYEQKVTNLLAALEGMLNAFLLAATNPDQRTAIENGEAAIAAHQGEGT